MENLVLLVHVAAAVALIVLVLLQHGKGADMGAAFGSGSAGSVFGSAGSANFLSRSTSVAATVFFATSLALTYISARGAGGSGVMSGVMKDVPAKTETTTTAPGAPSTTVPAAPAQKSNEVPK
jgi:preprotein translocase subunit SecG